MQHKYHKYKEIAKKGEKRRSLGSHALETARTDARINVKSRVKVASKTNNKHKLSEIFVNQ